MKRALARFLALPLYCAWICAGAAEPAQPVSGEAVYQRWCSHCHSAGRGNPGTESLKVKYGDTLPSVLLERTDLDAAAVKLFVRQGVLSMPPFRKTEITDAELAALGDYVAKRRASP
jgi:mono/diheme cytochrome c family protein